MFAPTPTPASPTLFTPRFHRHVPKNMTFTSAAFVDLALIFSLVLFSSPAILVRPAIPLHLPKSSFTAGVHYNALLITIAKEQLIFFNDERTSKAQLREALAMAIKNDPHATVVIQADESVTHETLIAIYNLAMGLGIRDIALATGVSPSNGPS